MTFLLCIYLFMQDGSVVQEKYDVSGNIDSCLSLGRTKGKELQTRHKNDGPSDFSFMCIKQGAA